VVYQGLLEVVLRNARQHASVENIDGFLVYRAWWDLRFEKDTPSLGSMCAKIEVSIESETHFGDTLVKLA
jgi:hypothetical protein